MKPSNRLEVPVDLQEHVARLEERGLLMRVERPINKDTELHPLVRWQFVGGFPEEARRAFLFTNVVGSGGERYDIPVVVGALAATSEIYALGMGVAVEELGDIWMKAIDNPIPPEFVENAPCHEVVQTGEELDAAGRRARDAAGTDLDAGFPRGPGPHRHRLRDQGSGNRRAQHGHLPGWPQGDGPARRAHGRAARRSRGLPALAQIPEARAADALRHRRRLRAGRGLHRPAEARGLH